LNSKLFFLPSFLVGSIAGKRNGAKPGNPLLIPCSRRSEVRLLGSLGNGRKSKDEKIIQNTQKVKRKFTSKLTSKLEFNPGCRFIP
jgi:hypothetical protein